MVNRAAAPEGTVLRKRVLRVITRRAGSSTAASAVAAATRLAHDDLTAVFAPLISSAGVEALWARAFDLARREYPADPIDERKHESSTADQPLALVTLWLEMQAPSVATEAAAAMFSTFAELLTTLIGEPLTMRYLERAWSGFSDGESKGKKA